MRHGLQHLLVSIGHQANGSENLQNRHFSFNVLRPQALRDGVDTLRMGQDMRASLRVVHQGLDAADDWSVDAALWRLVVHAAQEIEQAGESVEFDESCDEPKEAEEYRWRKLSYGPCKLLFISRCWSLRSSVQYLWLKFRSKIFFFNNR